MVFLALKRFLNVQKEQGEVYPSIKRICSMLQIGEKTVIEVIKNLVKKGVLQKKRQGLTKTNIYTIHDNAALWKCNTETEVTELLNNQPELLSADEHIEALKRLGYNVSISHNKNTENKPKQDCEKIEKYSQEQIRIFFDYDILVTNVHTEQADNIMAILYDVLNTTKDTIRIGKEEKPSNVVIGKLMKLSYMDIEYVIEQYSKVTSRVNHPIPYILTLLYHAKEQGSFDIANLVANDLNSF
jgi:predicted transcriptional regulator